MPFSIFSVKPKYYKNGLWWFTKMMAVGVGEHRWEAMNLFRRVWSNKFYYVSLWLKKNYIFFFRLDNNFSTKSSSNGLNWLTYLDFTLK